MENGAVGGWQRTGLGPRPGESRGNRLWGGSGGQKCRELWGVHGPRGATHGPRQERTLSMAHRPPFAQVWR